MGRGYLLFLGLLLCLVIEAVPVECCSDGFSIEGHKCIDVDECKEAVEYCGKNAVCYNTNGSYYCQCKTGFKEPSGNVNFTVAEGKQCIDFNECSESPDICGSNSTCVNSDGSYLCTCTDGFISSNREKMFNATQNVTCEDRDECTADMYICGKHAKCTNTFGGYYCTCNPGYRLPSGQTNFTDNGNCEHICNIDKSLCGQGVCSQTEDGYKCTCKAGFTNFGIKTKKCIHANCIFLTQNISTQLLHFPEKIVKELKSLCLKQTDVTHEMLQADATSLLEMLLNALDELLSAGHLNSSKKVTTVFEMTESILKMLGVLLSNTSMSAVHTEVKMLVRRGEVPPLGPFNLSTGDTQLESHWETAAGDSYLGVAAVSVLFYKSLEKSVNKSFDHIKTQEDKQIKSLKINSKVVTATVTNPDTAQLKKNITLTFSHLQQPTDGNQICVFWDSTLDDGAWSTEGCTMVSFNANHTVCSCSHLSSFAVLMALYEIEDVFELQLITWVGLSLSLICLFICILTFRFIRSIQNTRTTIHLHLCISLFIADLVFLAGITQTQNKVGCAFVAGLLHFFFLAALCWMCIEGVQLFRMVVLVFNTTMRPLYMMAGGYGIPALIVVISASINAKGYGTKTHCWLSLKDGFIWSFFGPVCAIIVVNIFFFLITVSKLAQKFSSLNYDMNNLEKIKSFTITAIAQLCVLGTMWIFGCFLFEDGSQAMAYLFTIFNSLQGVLVFVMHCLLSRQVREEYARILTSMCAPEKKKYSEFSTNQSSRSQASRSVQNTGESHI